MYAGHAQQAGFDKMYIRVSTTAMSSHLVLHVCCRRVAEGVAMPMQASLPKPTAHSVRVEELGAGLPGKSQSLRPILLLCDAASLSVHDGLFRAFAEGPRHCFLLHLPNVSPVLLY